MDYIEVSGKNVDEALTNALIKLETTSDKVEYEVIEKGSAGFLGMGRKLAVIKVRKKEDKPVEANVKAKETETQKVADSSVSYEPVKAEPVKSVDNNEIKDDSHEQPKKTSKYTTVMPNEEVERRITTFLGDMFKAMNLEVKIDVKFDDPDCVNVELSSGRSCGSSMPNACAKTAMPTCRTSTSISVRRTRTTCSRPTW